VKKSFDYEVPINLVDNHTLDLMKCRADVSKNCPANSSWSLRTSCCCSPAHCQSQWVPLNSTCKKAIGLQLSKTISFHVIQIVQHNIVAAVNNRELRLLPPVLDQLSNKSSMRRGGAIPNSKCTVRHRNLAWKHSKKRWWIISKQWQKVHFVSPVQLRLARLSLIRMMPLFKYHKRLLFL